MITLYGIKNCDTVRKARRWLEQHQLEYRFHDFRSDGLEAHTLQRWSDSVGWETLLNRRGTTWRKLPESEREQVDRDQAIALMLAQPTLIKRPVLERDGALLVGFSEVTYSATCGDHP